MLNAATSASNIGQHPHVNHSNRTTYQAARGKKLAWTFLSFRDYDYLITVDYLIIFFEVDLLPSKRAKDIIYCLRQHFARHGIPAIVFSDNSPFRCGEFHQFAQKYEFDHQTSSPRYPQSNGKAENAVKTAKGLMTKAARGWIHTSIPVGLAQHPVRALSAVTGAAFVWSPNTYQTAYRATTTADTKH